MAILEVLKFPDPRLRKVSVEVKNFDVKTFLAVFIMVSGMSAVIFKNLKPTTENSIIAIMLVVATFYFGSSQGSDDKTKLLNNKSDNN